MCASAWEQNDRELPYPHEGGRQPEQKNKGTPVDWKRVLERSAAVTADQAPLGRKLMAILRSVRAQWKTWENASTARVPLSGPSGFEQKGCIYLVLHISAQKAYVGQTYNTVLHRFKTHWHARWNLEDPLHLAVAKSNNVDDFTVLPLEHISTRERWTPKARFRVVARVQEYFWINALCTWAPNGYNVSGRKTFRAAWTKEAREQRK